MSLKDTLKKITRIGAATMVMGTATPMTQPQSSESVPYRDVAELETAVNQGNVINGQPASDRTAAFQKMKEQKGLLKTLDAISNSSVQTYEIREKDAEGNYHFHTFDLEGKGREVSEVWYPNGKLKSKTSADGKAVGYYPNGAKQFEQENINSPRSEYYPNGQLITTPHSRPEESFDYFDQKGMLIAHYHRVKTAGEKKSRQIDIYDEYNNKNGGYRLENYGPTLSTPSQYSGIITEITLPQINNGRPYKLKKPQQMTFDSVLATIDTDGLKEIYQEDIKSGRVNASVIKNMKDVER